MDSTRLFVYGTLRQACNNPMTRLLTENTQFIGYGVIQGRLYEVDGYPGLISSSDPLEQVTGEIYQFYEADGLLQRLDDYEECSKNFPQPTEFVRLFSEIKLSSGTTITAWTYFFNRPTNGLNRIISGDYLDLVSGVATLASAIASENRILANTK